MSRPAADDWALGEAEALLDTDGRRERLEQVVARLQNGEVLPVDHMTARSRIRQRLDARGGAQTLD
jgi:predicted nucleic acid-binding protein